MFFRPNGLGIASVQSYGPQLIIARTVDYGNTWSTITVDTTSFQGILEALLYKMTPLDGFLINMILALGKQQMAG
ncbi:MAG: hypothetical protein IPG39_16755 [Bacteroidetes bacterium]|nr:hypothetical protein [Bacteroidota bacterium]